jgi:hypothetical protein
MRRCHLRFTWARAEDAGMGSRLSAAALAILSLLIGACGDDGGGEALSRDEYVAAADELCSDFAEQGEALTEPETVDDVADLLTESIRLGESMSSKFAALQPPAEAEQVHASLRAALDGGVEKLRDAVAAIEAGDVDGMTSAVEEAVEIGQSSDEAAKAFGFEVCGSESEL